MQILSQLSRKGRPDPAAERRPASEPGPVDKFTYQAFISYSHAVDRKLAPALQARLRRFARPWYRWRGRSIFRDETGLALTEGLWPTISAALDGSKTFILLASPEAAGSVWVGREVGHWLSLRRRLPLIVLTSGELVWDGKRFDPARSTALPAPLLDAYSTEPKWVDLRWAREERHLRPRDPRFRQAVAELTAAVEGKSLEAVLDLEARQRRQLLGAATATTLALTAAFLWATLNLIDARRQLANNHLAQARSLAADRPDLARLHFAKVVEVASSWWLRRLLSEQEMVARGWLGQHYRQTPPVVLWHGDEVVDASYDRSGERVVTASRDGTVRVWAASTGEPLTRPVRPSAPGRLDSVSFVNSGRDLLIATWNESSYGLEVLNVERSEAGTRSLGPGERPDFIVRNDEHELLLTGDVDGTMRLRSTVSDEVVGTPFKVAGNLGHALLSPTGKHVLTITGENRVECWDAARGVRTAGPFAHNSFPPALQFSRDGTRFTVAPDEHTVEVMDSGTGRRVGQRLVHANVVTSVSLSADGNTVVTAGRNSTGTDTVQAWRLDSGQPLFPPIRYGKLYSAPEISPDGQSLVTVSGTHARLWDLNTGDPIGQEMEQGEQITSMGFSRDGRVLATGGIEGSVRVWEVPDGRPLLPPVAHQKWVIAMSFDPAGSRLLTASWDRTARVWPLAAAGPAGRVLGSAPGDEPQASHDGPIFSAAFSPDGALLVTSGADGKARLWDVASGARLRELQHSKRVNYAQFSPDGRRVLTASDDHTSAVWEAMTGQRLQLLQHPAGVSYAEFGPGGSRVVTACDDGHARVWDTATGAMRTDFAMHRKRVAYASFSPDGRLVVSSSDDGTARVWEVTSGTQVAAIEDSDKQVFMAVFDPTGRRVAVARAGGWGQVWDIAPLRAVTERFLDRNGVKSIAFSPDGARLVTGGLEGKAQVWDVASSRPVGAQLVHLGTIWRVAFSPDGERVVTASFDRTAMVWDATSGLPMGQPFRHDRELMFADFSPDGTRLATVGLDQKARVWDAAPARDTSESLRLQAETESTLTLDPVTDTIRMLSEREWQERKMRGHRPVGG